ncbi:MAG: AIR synthase related protein, partial [Gaiellaceae bacterium]
MNHLSQVAEQPLHRALGLTDGELARIVSLLEREPNHFELAVFSLLWSEHCGYKHSALLLKRLPSQGKRVLQGPGENAGVIDLGGGEAVCFKVESHNHPSAVEPFQGAATGVGGILRDIIAMGARPVALLDGLRFAPDDWRFDRAVAGIGHYGNCLAADERVVYRNSGRMHDKTIGELAEERGQMSGAPAWDVEPQRPFQVLSFDQETGETVWKDVRRVFKRQTNGLLRIKTSLGRSLTVTPDHPVMIWHEDTLVERPAHRVRNGDRIPLLASLPKPTDNELELDLIAEVTGSEAIVLLPSDWVPSKQLRTELRRFMPRADARHYRLSRRELPVGIFREVESLVEVARDRLRLRLPGPRSTHVPAVLHVDADFARLLGYYIAEGCCSANGTTTKIIWTFGCNERDRKYVEDVRRILSKLELRHAVEHRQSSIAITVSSRLLGRLFKDVLEIGSRSFEKQIPSIVMQAGTQLRREVLKGIFRGDGSFDFPKNGSAVRVRHSTTSLVLHHQLLLVLQSFGIFARRYDWRPTGDLPGGRTYRSREAHALEFYGAEAIEEAARWFLPEDAEEMLRAARQTANSPFARPRAQRHGALASVPVVSVEQIDGPAPVYDFEVPGTHLFATTGGIVTHNCVGVPTVGGEAFFDESYRDNVLVNAMCVGLLPADRVTRAGATGPGNLV